MDMDESTGHTTMYFEVHVAINFVTSFMNKVVPQGRVKVFGEALARALMNKYEGHWFPESPLKGSAYRCFEFGAYIEPELKVAARQAGLRCRDVLICVPSEMSIWVDPGTVSYRIGIEGPVKPVLNESGCVVTCFFDPDVEDPEPDPPGTSKAVSSCEETETVEKSRPRKFTPKRGKAKLKVAYEDLKFVSKNGGLDSATDCDDLEPLEPYFTAEDMKSGILCEDEEFTSNQLPSSDEPVYGNSRRRRSRRSKKVMTIDSDIRAMDDFRTLDLTCSLYVHCQYCSCVYWTPDNLQQAVSCPHCHRLQLEQVALGVLKPVEQILK